jgi:hypothetical protein
MEDAYNRCAKSIKMKLSILFLCLATLINAEIKQIQIPPRYNGYYQETVYSTDQGQTPKQPNETTISRLQDGVLTVPGNEEWQIDKVYQDTDNNRFLITFKDKPFAWLIYEKEGQFLIIFIKLDTEEEVFRMINVRVTDALVSFS